MTDEEMFYQRIADLTSKLLNREEKFLFELRVVTARLERYQAEYIAVGIMQDKFVALYQAMRTAIKIISNNLSILQKIRSCLKNPKEQITQIISTYEAFLATEHISNIFDKLMLATDVSWMAVILPAPIQAKDLELAEISRKYYEITEIEEFLLSKICKKIAIYALGYKEIFEALNALGFNLKLEQLNIATVACEQSYLLKLAYIDQVSLDAAMQELEACLNLPFYDREKHHNFLHKRDQVVKMISDYLINHEKELHENNLKELKLIIYKILVCNQLANQKLSDADYTALKLDFKQAFLDKLSKKVQHNAKLINFIKQIAIDNNKDE